MLSAFRYIVVVVVDVVAEYERASTWPAPLFVAASFRIRLEEMRAQVKYGANDMPRW